MLISFIAGVAVRSFIALPMLVVLVSFLIAAGVIAFGIRRARTPCIVWGVCACVFLCGVIRFSYAAEVRPDLSKFLGEELLMHGIVWEAPEYTEKLQRVKVKITEIDGRMVRESFYALATVRRYPSYMIGDMLGVRGVLEAPSNYSEFDYVSYLARDRIFSTISFPAVTKIGEGKGPWLRSHLALFRRAFEEKIDVALSEPHAGFLKGLVLGERESIPSDIVAQFARTGTSHIVALSGYNITLIGRFFMATLLFLTVPFQISFWVAAIGIILFVMLTGASASVVRAGIMGVLVLVAEREGRMYHMTNALMLAAAAMIFHNPYLVRFDAAFQLSFLATAGLVYLSPWVESAYECVRFRVRDGLGFAQKFFRKRKTDRYTLFPARRILLETLSAQLAVLPLLIYLFGRISLVSPLTNVLVLIAVPYAMTFGFITGGAGFLWGPLGILAGWVTWIFLEYMLRVIGFFARFPAASVEAGVWVYAFVVFIYGWLLVRFLRSKSVRGVDT